MNEIARNNYKTVAELLAKRQRSLTSVLPTGIRPEKVMRIALNEIMGTPKLLECTPRSLVSAVVEAAELGLVVKRTLGQAYLVPYVNRKAGTTTCQLIIGYRGMIKLAYQNPLVKSISAYAVYPSDEFNYQLGLHPDLVHKPSLAYQEIGALTHTYAIAELKTGGVIFVVLDRKKIEEARNRSKSKDFGPWITDYEPMAIKTAIRRLWKMIPGCDEIVDIDDLEDPERREIDITPDDDDWAQSIKPAPLALEEKEDESLPINIVQEATPVERAEPVVSTPQTAKEPPAANTQAPVVDANGEIFDPARHGISADGTPAMNANGTFRRKRGTVKKRPQQNADTSNADGDETDGQDDARTEDGRQAHVMTAGELDEFVASLRQAQNLADVNTIVRVFEAQSATIPKQIETDFRMFVSTRKAELLNAQKSGEGESDPIPF